MGMGLLDLFEAADDSRVMFQSDRAQRSEAFQLFRRAGA